jgi:hypothetical protein
MLVIRHSKISITIVINLTNMTEVCMSEKITELAHIRNKLASGFFSKEDEQVLSKTKDKISSLDSSFKEIALNAINNCEQNIRNNEWELAAQEIQLIHNFTFEDAAKWNSDYFYKVELLSYLEQTDDVKRIKKLISLLATLPNI